jgi:hypothetical protein
MTAGLVYESYQFRLHRNDGEWGVIRGEWGNVELLTLTLSFPSNRKRYHKTKELKPESQAEAVNMAASPWASQCDVRPSEKATENE